MELLGHADLELPASGLVNTDLAAQVAGVKPGTIRQWKLRGHLDVARDIDGQEFRDALGRHLFEVADVIEAEYRLRTRARRSTFGRAA